MRSVAELGPVLSRISSSHCYLPQAPSRISSFRPLPNRLLPAQLEQEIPCQRMPGTFLGASPAPMTPRAGLGPGVRRSRSDPGGPSSAWGAESGTQRGGKTLRLFLPWYLTFKSLPSLSRHPPLSDVRGLC